MLHLQVHTCMCKENVEFKKYVYMKHGCPPQKPTANDF